MFWNLTGKLLADGDFEVHTPCFGKDGITGVLDGLQALRENIRYVLPQILISEKRC